MHDRDVKSAINICRLLPVLWLLVFSAGCKTMPAQPEGRKVASHPSRIIKSIEAINGGDTAQVIIKATQVLQYSSVKQVDPPAVILIFPETGLSDDVPPVYTPKIRAISSIRSDVSAGGKNVRMEIDLTQNLSYEIARSGDNLRIALSTAPGNAAGSVRTPAPTPAPVVRKKIPESNPSTPAPAAQKSAAQKSATQKSATVKSRASSNTKPGASENPAAPARIEKIDFSAEKSGRSSIVIGTEYPVSYQIQKISERLIVFELKNCLLPKHRRNRPLITTRFESAIDRIIPVQAPDGTHTVDIIVELRSRVPYRAEQAGNLISIHFEPSDIGPRPFSAADLPPWKEVLDEAVKMTSSDTSAKDEKKPLSEYEKMVQETKEYIGQPVALDFYNTNIRNVFEILQQVSGKNYAIDPDVKGSVTISMKKPVPWDQVLDLILTQNKLGMAEQGDIIRIANKLTLKADYDSRRERLKAYQKQKEMEKTLAPKVTEYIHINYASAGKEILPHIKPVLTKDNARVSVDKRNNQIIITDTKSAIERAREIIKHIDTVTPQVIIEAQIVEVSTDFTRQIGVTWSAENSAAQQTNGVYDYNVSVNNPDIGSAGNIGFGFKKLGSNLILKAQLNALETEGQGKILSSPKIVTLDNKPATITQEDSYPYITTSTSNGVTGPQVNYVNVKLSLTVTPIVTPDDRVSLTIVLNKGSVLKAGNPPVVTTNTATTELLVDDGSTLVIGGIMKKNMNMSEVGYPVLKDIPILGWFFKSKTNTTTKSELLIFMTPRIVRLDQRQLAEQ